MSRLIPVIDYVRLFNGMGASHRSIEKDLIPTSILKEQFNTIHTICIESLSNLKDEILLTNWNLFLLSIPWQITNTKHYLGVLNMKCGIVRKWKL